jgi:BASS family bile acid:Na+ symporter
VVALAITIGHLLGGPNAADRKSLAIASAMRHPGVALAVASVNGPDEPGAAAAVLLYVIIAAFLTTVYAKGQPASA